jgi:hypothetical protein
MHRIAAAPLVVLAFAIANVGPTLCAAVHGHTRASVEHAHHDAQAAHAAHAAPAGDAWESVPDPDHHVDCPDPAHCGLTLVGPAQRGAVVTVALRPVGDPAIQPAEGTPRRLPAPATPPPKA